MKLFNCLSMLRNFIFKVPVLIFKMVHLVLTGTRDNQVYISSGFTGGAFHFKGSKLGSLLQIKHISICGKGAYVLAGHHGIWVGSRALREMAGPSL